MRNSHEHNRIISIVTMVFRFVEIIGLVFDMYAPCCTPCEPLISSEGPGRREEAVAGMANASTGDKADKAVGDNNVSGGVAVSPLMGPSLAAAAGVGEEKKKKRRKSASSVKSKKKLEEERAVAFDAVHRTLLAPVTHLSPASGGRPHDPLVFARVAKPALEKVGWVGVG